MIKLWRLHLWSDRQLATVDARICRGVHHARCTKWPVLSPVSGGCCCIYRRANAKIDLNVQHSRICCSSRRAAAAQARSRGPTNFRNRPRGCCTALILMLSPFRLHSQADCCCTRTLAGSCRTLLPGVVCCTPPTAALPTAFGVRVRVRVGQKRRSTLNWFAKQRTSQWQTHSGSTAAQQETSVFKLAPCTTRLQRPHWNRIKLVSSWHPSTPPRTELPANRFQNGTRPPISFPSEPTL